MKRKFEEEKSKSGISQLKTPKATSLSGSVSNCRYNSAEVRQKTMEDSISQVERSPEIENAHIEDELKILKESNASLLLKLNKSREENVGLESFIQNLEEIVKQQNLDMEIPPNLTAHMESPWLNDEENVTYMERVVSMCKRAGQMIGRVCELKEELEMMEDCKHWKPIKDIKLQYESDFNAQESEISSLKARLLESVPETSNAETVCRNVGYADLLKQTEELKEKDHEHEMWEMNSKNAIEDESKKFLKESNASLSLQLKKSREEKVRLDSVIQNLKDTIVEQEVDMLKPEARSLWLIKQEREMYLRYIDLLCNIGYNLFAMIEKLKKKVNEIEDTEDAKNLEKKISDIKMDYERKLSAQKEEISSLKAKLENVTC